MGSEAKSHQSSAPMLTAYGNLCDRLQIKPQIIPIFLHLLFFGMWICSSSHILLSLFPHPLHLGEPCDLLWTIGQ